MDRDRIERRDFPATRRGYDREEVHAHLRAVADEVERLERERQASAGLAGPAADQIREIIGAAERSAAEIRERAETEARSAGEETESRARDVRARAEADAREHVERAHQATERLLDQTAAAEAELGRLLDALRAEGRSFVETMRENVEAVQSELGRIGEGLPALHGVPGPPRSLGAEAALAAGEARAPVPREETSSEVDVVGEAEEELPAGEAPDEFEVEEGEPAAESEVGELPPEEGERRGSDAEGASLVEPPAGAPDDVSEASPEEVQAEEPDEEAGVERRAIAGSEGARLIALNMALNGTPRDETARYLSENFKIDDQERVLDEVYSRVGA